MTPLNWPTAKTIPRTKNYDFILYIAGVTTV